MSKRASLGQIELENCLEEIDDEQAYDSEWGGDSDADDCLPIRHSNSKNTEPIGLRKNSAGNSEEDVSPDGYRQLLGLNFYKFHGELATSWEQARQVCVEEGGHLAVVNSEEESRVLSKMFAAANVSAGAIYDDVAYIGFHDMFAEGHYTTIFDEPLEVAGFARWKVGEPTDALDENFVEDCGGFDKNSGGLHDVVCNLLLAFICERV